MSGAYGTIVVDVSEGIGTIRLNRPQALNAIDSRMLAELEDAVGAMERDDAVRVLVITGTGRAFSAGRDLKEVGGEGHRTGGELWARLEAMDKPVIGAVNGLCYTGALSMLLSFDLVVASETAVFADTHAKYAMRHGGGTTQRLRDLVGARRAKEILFTCEPIDARTAERIGLVNRVVPADALDATVRELARAIAKNDAAALASGKRLVNAGLRWGTAVGLDLELREYLDQRRGRVDEVRTRADSFFDRKGTGSA